MPSLPFHETENESDFVLGNRNIYNDPFPENESGFVLGNLKNLHDRSLPTVST